MAQVPYPIQAIVGQLGGMGLQGAIAYTGGHNFAYACKSGRGDSKVTPEGCVDYDTGFSFHVNGKRGRKWIIIVSLEFSDTYTVYLWQSATPKKRGQGIYGEILDKREDVYCDMLQEVAERMYDNAIKKYNKGFISI